MGWSDGKLVFSLRMGCVLATIEQPDLSKKKATEKSLSFCSLDRLKSTFAAFVAPGGDGGRQRSQPRAKQDNGDRLRDRYYFGWLRG